MKFRSFYTRALLVLAAISNIGANSAAAQAKPLTAREVIARIQAHVGIPWQQDTVDTFKAGNPDAEVHGIAVTMMATLDVLQRAAASGQNLIITHEPTFYGHQDRVDDLERESDAVYAAKKALIGRPNVRQMPDCGSWPCGLSNSAASAGDSVSDTVAEMMVEAVMVSANCR